MKFLNQESIEPFEQINLLEYAHIEEVEIATGVDKCGVCTDLIGVVAKGGDLYVSNKKEIYDDNAGFSVRMKPEPYVRLLCTEEAGDEKTIIEIGCHKGTIYMTKKIL